MGGVALVSFFNCADAPCIAVWEVDVLPMERREVWYSNDAACCFDELVLWELPREELFLETSVAAAPSGIGRNCDCVPYWDRFADLVRL